VLLSTLARFDLPRLVAGFRRFAGDDVARLAERDYGGDPVSDEEWARVFAAFGPHVPGPEALARRIRNLELGRHGMERMRRLDVVADLARIDCPTLVCVGERDAPTWVDAAREIVAGLRPGLGRLEVIAGAGHFPWLDAPDAYWAAISEFVTAAGALAADAPEAVE
jgi:proline iminopeptidase